MNPRLWLVVLVALALLPGSAAADPRAWQREWPDTDFSKRSVDLEEIISGGPPKDGIPSIDDPTFVPVEEAHLPHREPVIGLVVDGEAKAYPLRILMWHEIVNDEIAGVPVAVTYCPLCNTSIVFDRRARGRVLEFGTTGKLRNSDLVMYDRATASWWQQFLGEAIVGELTGTRLETVPSRLESFANFKERAPDGLVQVPADERMRAYGRTPYAGYDGAPRPFLYQGPMPGEVPPLARVVRVGDQAWSLDLVRERGTLEAGDLHLTYEAGQASALDQSVIAEGQDVGNVVVRRRTPEGFEDVAYSVDFAFAFHAFYPGRTIHTRWPPP